MCILNGMARHKPMTVAEMARMGGLARAETQTADELSKQGRKAANSRWANATEEERKAHGEMLAKARAAKRHKPTEKGRTREGKAK